MLSGKTTQEKYMVQGKCIMCGGTEPVSLNLCADCLKKHNAASAALKQKNVKAGRCAWCSKQNSGDAHTCDDCRELYNERKRLKTTFRICRESGYSEKSFGGWLRDVRSAKELFYNRKQRKRPKRRVSFERYLRLFARNSTKVAKIAKEANLSEQSIRKIYSVYFARIVGRPTLQQKERGRE